MYCTRYRLFSTISLSALFLSSAAYGLPQGGTVAAGNATIASSGMSATVTQGSGRAAIDWRSFDVGAGEKVEFKQPSASSVTLNRIHDQKPSEILGSITANGQVILANPNGMLFGKDSRIDVAGLVATSASAGTDAFMRGGRLALDQAGKPDAKIVSRGTITAKEAGLIALVAPRVENTGTITARLGKVQLAGADTAAVDLYGDGLVAVAVTGKAASTSVTQSGRITAGRIALAAADAVHLVESVVNTMGVLEASDARVVLGGTVFFGGKIELTGRDVTVGERAELHADGPDGGGIIKIGGGWQGRGTIKNASNTTIAKGAVVTANAREKGQGGTIAVWADQATQFDGTIEARGGPKGGNGGSVETSGKEHLGVTGTVDASAPKGKAGDWLLDPRNVTISGAGSYSVNPAGETVDPGSDGFTILDSSISAALSGGNNVTITTGTTGAQTGDITLSNATISKTGGGDATLTLKADGSVLTSGTNAITSTSGKLHTILWSDADSVNRGKISLVATTITTNGGDIVMAGKLDDGANGGVAGDGRPDGFAETNLDNGVNIGSNSFLNAGGGNIMAIGYGPQRGVLTLGGAQITTSGAGNITFIGSSYGSGLLSYGVNINNSSYIAAESGAITLTGSSTGAATNNYGTVIENAGAATTVETTGNGNINITSMKSAGCCADFALGGSAAASVRSLGTGTITVSADSISMGNPNAIIQTNGSIAFRPRTASTTFGISGGTCGSSCNIPLTDAILARLFPDNDGNGIGSLIIGDKDAGTGLVDINGWDLLGKTYDVEVYGGTVDLTGGPITWNGGNDLTLHSRTGDLVIDQNFTRNAGTAGDGTLTIKAAGNITTSGTHTISAASGGTSGKLHTILWSDAETAPNNDGYIYLTGTSITTNGGDIVMGGGLDNGADVSDPFSGGIINDGILGDGRPDGYAWGNNANRTGILVAAASSLSVGDGNLLLLGRGMNNNLQPSNSGITINSPFFSTNGNITLIGRGGDTSGSTSGIRSTSAGTISTINGNITLLGFGGNGGSFNRGIDINGFITSSGTGSSPGSITLVGQGGTGTTEGAGIIIETTSGVINSVDAPVSLKAASTLGPDIYFYSGSDINMTGAGDISLTSLSNNILFHTGGMDIGGPATRGDITITANGITYPVGTLNIQTSGTVNFKPHTSGRLINVAGGSGGLDIAGGVLDTINAGTITIGDATSGLITVNPYGSWASRASSGVSFVSGSGGVTFATGAHDFGTRSLTATTAGAINVNGALTVGSAVLRTTGATSDITIGATGGITASGAGDALTLASGRNFINNRGAAALSTPAARWLVYSGNPGTNATGGLIADFSRYACEYV